MGDHECTWIIISSHIAHDNCCCNIEIIIYTMHKAINSLLTITCTTMVSCACHALPCLFKTTHGGALWCVNYTIVIRAQCGVYEIYKPEGLGCSTRAKRGATKGLRVYKFHRLHIVPV